MTESRLIKGWCNTYVYPRSSEIWGGGGAKIFRQAERGGGGKQFLAYLLVEPFQHFALKGLGKTLKQRSNIQKACPIGQRSCKSQLPRPKTLLPRAIGQAIHRSLHRFMCTFIHSYAHVFSVCTVIMIGDSHFPFHSQIVTPSYICPTIHGGGGGVQLWRSPLGQWKLFSQPKFQVL